MKIDRFKAPGLYIERQEDRWNGASFIAWKPHVSQGFTDRRALLRFIAWPVKTPTGDRIREWLNSFEKVAELLPEPAKPELSPEVLATGFGPECHLDETDPNHNTRTVI
jgi:hypothetical protein